LNKCDEIIRRERQLAHLFAHGAGFEDELNRFIEPLGPGLNQLFVLRVKGCDWVGRKVLQQEHGGGWRLSSRLKPWMLLGPLTHLHWGNEGAVLYFRSVDQQQKHAAFGDALGAPDSEIYFPFPVMDDTGAEFVCPADYWQVDESLATQLDADEAHFRQQCVAVLKSGISPDSMIHDPACSTGQFIAHLARELPGHRYLGSDRSASMIDYAQRQHGHGSVTFFLGDARQAAANGIRCDVLILRLLNAEVMTRCEAQQTLRDVLAGVNPGGLLIVFGHTPVLIAVPYLAEVLQLRLESCVAARSGHTELFQFYCLRVPA